MKICGIYGFVLRDHSPGQWYVGQSKSVVDRRAGHLRRYINGSTRFHRALLHHGARAFEFVILEECDEELLIEMEDFRMRELGSLNTSGFNVRPAHETRRGVGVSDATRARISKSSKRVWMDRDYRDRMRGNGLGKILSPETRLKMSIAAKGKKKTPEHAAAISAGRKGWSPTPEQRIAMSVGQKGNKRSPESIRKVADALRGRRRPQEVIDKIRAAKRHPIIATMPDGTASNYNHARHAAKCLRIDHRTVKSHIDSRTPTAGGVLLRREQW